MAFLFYHFPGENLVMKTGKWEASTIEDLPDECFFISRFKDNSAYYFVEEQDIEEWKEEDLFFRTLNDVFVINGQSYLLGVEAFRDGFDKYAIKKAIYSRIKLVERLKEDRIKDIFQQMLQQYKDKALVYLISGEELGTWMGATPEVLLEKESGKIQTMALAGTKFEKEKEWTPKEIEEHQFVVDDIHSKLKLQGGRNIVKGEMKTVAAGAVYHLQTDFSFNFPPENCNQLMKVLHPTPAVCGTPRDKSKPYILFNEPHEREFYTGLIGQKNKEEIKVYVNLRCMQILTDNYALYVGGGITKSSNSAEEFQETEDKSMTLISVIDGENEKK